MSDGVCMLGREGMPVPVTAADHQTPTKGNNSMKHNLNSQHAFGEPPYYNNQSLLSNAPPSQNIYSSGDETLSFRSLCNAQYQGNNNKNNRNLSQTPTYYGIFSPTTPGKVFTDISVAASESKKLNARFKRFTSEQEALRFSQTGQTENTVREPRPKLQENKEKSPARKRTTISRVSQVEDVKIPSVPQRELTRFRLAVEKGNLDFVVKCTAENPRYLITTYDKPTVLQPGPHYNALHCAAKTGQKTVADTIMQYLLSDVPWKMFYPNDNINSGGYTERRNIVVDAYFNTSDKGCGETPLHFACKFGHSDFVKWMLQYPQVDITRRNKHDQTALEIAGSRCAEAEEMRQKISTIMDECRHSVYIPVIRAVDNSTPPFLGNPIPPDYLYSSKGSSNSSKILVEDVAYEETIITSDFQSSSLDSSLLNHSLNLGTLTSSPLSPSLSISAYAGPMSLTEAKEFRRQWKTPPRELCSRRRDILQDIMRSDCDRGLERVGRDLAIQQKVKWTEYWEFLESFVDLRESDGLEKLEKFLEECGTIFITGDNPTKMDQDVLHALPPYGIGQNSNVFPRISQWYQSVLRYPESERKCWTTPVAVRKKEPTVISETPVSTQKLEQRTHDKDVVRNLLSDLSLEDTTISPIPHILVKGVSELSISDTNKYFPKNIPKASDNLYDLPDTQENVSPTKTDTKLPILNANCNDRRRHPETKNSEPRLRHPKSSTDLANINEVDVPTYRVRRYFSTQLIRWSLLFIIVWTVYFIYINISTDLVNTEKRLL